MKNKQLLSMIARRKRLLNFLLNFLSPTNMIIVHLSQNLDELIVKYQSVQLRTTYNTDNYEYKCAA